MNKFGFPWAYAGFLRGGGATIIFWGIWIYMSPAAKMRAVAMGVCGHAPPRKF